MVKNTSSAAGPKPADAAATIGGGGGPGGGGQGKRPPRGHKQKGGGTVIGDKGPIERGGVTVQSWQRLPDTLLQEWCQKEKRPRPNYNGMSTRGEPGVKMQVVLPDPKVPEKSLRFAPTVTSEDNTIARENAALLALLHLMPTLPLERKLPDPYKTTWIQSTSSSSSSKISGGGGGGGEEAKKRPSPPPSSLLSKGQEKKQEKKQQAATVGVEGKNQGAAGTGAVPPAKAAPQAVVLQSAFKFMSIQEKKSHEEQKRQGYLKKQTERERKNRGREDHRIMMSARMRKIVEEALGITHDEADTDSDESEDLNDEEEEEGEVQVEDEAEGARSRGLIASVTAMGFTEKHTKKAIRILGERCGGDIGADEVVDYLLLHLKEEELPAAFDPRGRNFDVVLHKKEEEEEPKGEGFGANYGLRFADCQALMEVERGEEKALEALARAIYDRVGSDRLLIDGDGGGGEGGDDRYEMGFEEELEALRAIYGEDHCVVVVGEEGWRPRRVRLTGGLEEEGKGGGGSSSSAAALEVWLTAGYPEDGSLPLALLVGSKASSQVQLDLARAALPLRGHAMLYELLLVAIDALNPVVGAATKKNSGRKAPLLLAKGEEEHFVLPPPPPRPSSPSSSITSFTTASSDRGWRGGIGKEEKRARRPSGSAYGFFGGGKVPECDAALEAKLEGRRATAEGRKMMEARSRLPAAKAKADFLHLLAHHRVVLVAGETGCGKTTQIPQFILEEAEAAGQGSSVKVVVSQPRRIAAIGVAARVADERGEAIGAAGSSIGYMIRGENKTSPSTRLVFCTTGIILRRLQGTASSLSPKGGGDGGGRRGVGKGEGLGLEGVTHLVMDEVHERGLDSDFLLLLVKRLLRGSPHLRVILMSATMDSQRLAYYFKDVLSSTPPIMSIPGFTYRVEDVWLEKICGKEGFLGYTPPKLRTMFDEWEDGECGSGHMEKEATIDYRLLGALIRYIASPTFAEGHPGPAEGSVLVFLPGVGEINRLLQELRRGGARGDGYDEEEGDDVVEDRSCSKLWALPLHGGLSGADQSQVFRSPPKGLKKVVVATNVAETSITIPDVTVVVDYGRVKENGYDPMTRVACLVEGWASQDSIRQRRGRAGRVRPGVAFHLLTSPTFAKLPLHSTPEVKRTPLEQMVLQVMTMLPLGNPRPFLARMLDPPEAPRVESAIDTLKEVQAVIALEAGGGGERKGRGGGEGEMLQVTPLGRHLAALPCPVMLGKMLIYGAILGVSDPTLSIAAGMLARPPFLSAGSMDPEKKKTIEAARRKLLGHAGKSDHLLLAVAMERYEAVGGSASASRSASRSTKLPSASITKAQRQFCHEYGLLVERMMEMQQLRSQLARDLSTLGFSPSTGADGARALLVSLDEKGNRAYWRLVRATVSLGLYPNIIKVLRPPPKYAKVAGGAMQIDSEARELKFFIRSAAEKGGGGGGGGGDKRPFFLPEDRVFLHPGSINFSVGTFTVPWLAYSEIVLTTKAFVRDCTEASPYALLLAAKSLKVIHPTAASSSEWRGGGGHHGTILLDEEGWIRFNAVGRIAALVSALKKRVEVLLEQKVGRPDVNITGSLEARALVKLIATDGMG